MFTKEYLQQLREKYEQNWIEYLKQGLNQSIQKSKEYLKEIKTGKRDVYGCETIDEAVKAWQLNIKESERYYSILETNPDAYSTFSNWAYYEVIKPIKESIIESLKKEQFDEKVIESFTRNEFIDTLVDGKLVRIILEELDKSQLAFDIEMICYHSCTYNSLRSRGKRKEWISFRFTLSLKKKFTSHRKEWQRVWH